MEMKLLKMMEISYLKIFGEDVKFMILYIITKFMLQNFMLGKKIIYGGIVKQRIKKEI